MLQHLITVFIYRPIKCDGRLVSAVWSVPNVPDLGSCTNIFHLKGGGFVKLDSLETLYVEELRDLYNAEQQILKALPKMAKAASSSNLQKGFQEHLQQTKEQVNSLDQIFADLGKSPKGKKCEAMEGLLKEGAELLDAQAEPSVLDAALIAAAQRVEHYEIAGYGCVRTYAKLLGHGEATTLLQQTLDEEKSTDEKLTKLAVGSINTEAVDPEEAPEKKSPTQKRARA